MKTIVRQANQLSVGDVIVAPDRTLHTVTHIDIHGLGAAWLTIHTDTGLSLDKTQEDAKLDTYDVLASQQDHSSEQDR
ncbi:MULTISPECIES: hypothetical protein [Mycobacterium]|uniref:Uncharacterized protein n=4 Tax=Mycobacterium TaxID=1763 RepID=A0AAW5S8H0_MYCBC|nr:MULTISPECIES: hypothetical protein [Mycobacterium]MBZ4631669.1 hypothetical protein [Mycobacterium avium subsp. hominissuis]MCV6991844.1 hypothetical protein [Mycobacterium bouchedurhonense]MCV6993665.1 hypothetical protein [Mycobacterium timonense]ORA45755.1 hypothetical protein BST19_19855 [Mycobacterium bouchedurhonense]ORB76585.1 hypothetical protein BST46_29260 [Mycobacterium timonense]